MSGSNSNGFKDIWESIQASELKTALSLGFSSREELFAAREAERLKAEERHRRSEAASHRQAVLAAFSGRIRDDIAAKIKANDELGETASLTAIKQWLEGPHPVIVLSGGTGTGKTVAAAWAICSRQVSFQVMRSTKLGPAFERWQTDREDGIDPLKLWVGTLLIDDLGTEAIDDRRTASAIDEVFDARQTSDRRTIVTTNLTREQMRARYSDRVISRLAQNARVIDLNQTSDMRRMRG